MKNVRGHLLLSLQVEVLLGVDWTTGRIDGRAFRGICNSDSIALFVLNNALHTTFTDPLFQGQYESENGD